MKTLIYVFFILFVLFIIHSTPSYGSLIKTSNFQAEYEKEALQIDEIGQSFRDVYRRGILRNETNDELTELEALGINELTHSRTFPFLLLPLLATPFVPVLFAPVLILTSVVGLFFNQFSDLAHFGQVVDFLSKIIPTEHFLVPVNDSSTIRLSGETASAALIEQLHARFVALTSWESLMKIHDHTLKYFNIYESTCQQKMICDTAFAVATRLPTSLSNVARTATGFMFSKINSNAFFRAWIIGLTKDNCTAAYESCKESPFIKILKS